MENKKTEKSQKAFRKVVNTYTTMKWDNFCSAKEQLKTEGYNLISMEDFASFHINAPKDPSPKNSWIKEGIIFNNSQIYLTKNSPILYDSENARISHKNHEEFYLTKKQITNALKESVKIKKQTVPSLRLSEEEWTSYLFGKVAKDYGHFLKQHKIENLFLEDIFRTYTPLKRDESKTFARQLYFELSLKKYQPKTLHLSASNNLEGYHPTWGMKKYLEEDYHPSLSTLVDSAKQSPFLASRLHNSSNDSFDKDLEEQLSEEL